MNLWEPRAFSISPTHPHPQSIKGGDVCHVRGSGDRAAGADVVREGTCKAHTERRHELSSEVWEMEV